MNLRSNFHVAFVIISKTSAESIPVKGKFPARQIGKATKLKWKSSTKWRLENITHPTAKKSLSVGGASPISPFAFLPSLVPHTPSLSRSAKVWFSRVTVEYRSHWRSDTRNTLIVAVYRTFREFESGITTNWNFFLPAARCHSFTPTWTRYTGLIVPMNFVVARSFCTLTFRVTPLKDRMLKGNYKVRHTGKTRKAKHHQFWYIAHIFERHSELFTPHYHTEAKSKGP